MISLLDCFFYSISSMLVASSLAVILVRHPVRAALFLVLSFVMAAMLWMLLEAEFLSLVLIFVYVGAIMTLFLFVIMMLPAEESLSWKKWRGFPFALLLFALLLSLLFYMLKHSLLLGASASPADTTSTYTNTQAIGHILYTQYALPFEMIGILLLVAMVAAIMLTFRGRRVDAKGQCINKQVRASKQDQLKLVNIPSEGEKG